MLDCPSYHCILGLTLLQKIEAGVFCSTRKLQFKLGKAGGNKTHAIPLMPRSWVKTTPAYLAAQPQLPPDCEAAELVPGGAWEGALVEAEQAAYVEEGLVDLLGAAAMNNEAAALTQHPPLLPTGEAVDTWGEYEAPGGQPPAATTRCTASPPPSPALHKPPRKVHHVEVLHTEALEANLQPPTRATPAPPRTCREEQLALQHLGGELQHPEWVCATSAPEGVSRQAWRQLHVQQVDTEGRALRGYGERRKKGKPIDKQPLRKQLLAESNTKIVVTGPDFAGSTTLLQQLHRVGYTCNFLRDKPAPATRGEFCPAHF